MKAVKLVLLLLGVALIVARFLSHTLPPYRKVIVDRLVTEQIDRDMNHYVYLRTSEGKPDGIAFASGNQAMALKPGDHISVVVRRDLFGVLHDSPMGGEIVIGFWYRFFDFLCLLSAAWIGWLLLSIIRSRFTTIEQ